MLVIKFQVTKVERFSTAVCSLLFIFNYSLTVTAFTDLNQFRVIVVNVL